MRKERILYIYPTLSSFIKGDAEILSREYEVTHFRVHPTSWHSLLRSLINQLFHLIFNLRKYDIVYIWFADYHSFLPTLFCKRFKKRCYIVAGGYDVCREKKYGYGSFTNPIRGFMTARSIKNCTTVIAVSKNIKQIIRHVFPSTNCVTIYNGVVLKPGKEDVEKESLVLTVSMASTAKNVFIKGIDRIIEVADLMQETKFILIGTERQLLEKIGYKIPDNLQVLGFVDHSHLQEIYSKSKVYCQLSRRESFCLALAEAMLYNCNPVITNIGGMPEVTGKNGFIINEYSAQNCSFVIKKALEAKTNSLGRERILSEFTIETRAEKILNLLESN